MTEKRRQFSPQLKAEAVQMVVGLGRSLAAALSSCLVCSGFRAQQTIMRIGRSGSEGLFGDLIPHPKSGSEFGAVIGGSHPMPRRAEVRRDTAERGQKPLR